MVIKLKNWRVKVFLDFVHPDDRNNTLEVLSNLSEGKVVNEFINRYSRKDSTYRWIEWRSISYNNLIYAAAHDITDRISVERNLRIAKEKAEETNRLKTNFLANMSHEIRTPMVGILGFSQLLLGEEDIDEVKHIANVIFSSGKRLMETLNLILDLSRIESGESKPEYELLDVAKEVYNALMLFRAVAEKSNILLSFSSYDEAISLYTDKRALLSVVNNLVNNALKYTIEGEVKVSIEKEIIDSDEWIIINIIDTGIGIAEEHVEQIFEEFRQVSEGIGRTYQGTGLGLTLCKKLTAMIGGSIALKSKINEGSTFSVRLPLIHEPKIDVSGADESVKHIPDNYKNINMSVITNSILVVDDDFSSNLLVTKFLKGLYDIEVATNAIESIEKAKTRLFSAILMDINLGRGMNGLEALHEIRKIQNYENVPIIALTAYAMPGDKEEFLSSGCDYYISKPFKRNVLLNLLNKILV